jgi:hypothetical protein
MRQAIDSLAASIGAAGSASEIAIPATIGAGSRRVHSAALKSAFVDHQGL